MANRSTSRGIAPSQAHAAGWWFAYPRRNSVCTTSTPIETVTPAKGSTTGCLRMFQCKGYWHPTKSKRLALIASMYPVTSCPLVSSPPSTAHLKLDHETSSAVTLGRN